MNKSILQNRCRKIYENKEFKKMTGDCNRVGGK